MYSYQIMAIMFLKEIVNLVYKKRSPEGERLINILAKYINKCFDNIWIKKGTRRTKDGNEYKAKFVGSKDSFQSYWHHLQHVVYT